MITDSFLAEKRGTLERAREARLQELIKFRLSSLAFFKLLKKKNHLGRVSPSHFLQNVLIET